MALHLQLTSDSVYLWTLPMFHCNGWCFQLGCHAAGAVHLCLPKLEPALIWRHIRESAVHPFLCGTDRTHDDDLGSRSGKQATAACAHRHGRRTADPTLLERLAELGMDITHLYGLTENLWSGGDLRLAIGVAQSSACPAGSSEVAAGCRQRHLDRSARGGRRRQGCAGRRNDARRDCDRATM